jgi:hypothetical protein
LERVGHVAHLFASSIRALGDQQAILGNEVPQNQERDPAFSMVTVGIQEREYYK